ncbi:SAM-dependent methyltransferase [Spirillospora sp. NBC_00431]
MVCAHSRALIRNPDNVGVIEADLRRPDTVLRHETTRALLDFSRPVAVMMVSMLHFVDGADAPPGIVARYRDATAQGSHLVISHLTGDLVEKARPAETERAKEIYRRTASPVHLRTRQDIGDLFKGADRLAPRRARPGRGGRGADRRAVTRRGGRGGRGGARLRWSYSGVRGRGAQALTM